MKDIGLQAYRLSVSWPRVLPEGTGTINRAGLDFYDKLIDELLDANIDPWVTLFHWDFPVHAFSARRLAQSRKPEVVRGIYQAHRRSPVRSRLALDHVERAAVLHRPRAFVGRARAGPQARPGGGAARGASQPHRARVGGGSHPHAREAPSRSSVGRPPRTVTARRAIPTKILPPPAR